MLPKITHPSFPYTLPVSKKKIELRPMTVKEEKILLFERPSDKDEETEEQLYHVLAKVIDLCVTSPAEFESSSLCPADFEFIVLMLRAVSTNNMTAVTVTVGQRKYEVKFDLNDYKITDPVGAPTKISLGNKWWMTLRYPSVKSLPANGDPINLIKQMIDTVYNDKESYKFSDYTDEEQLEFIETMSAKTTLELNSFYQTMPRIYFDLPCDEHIVRMEGVKNFFL